MSRPYTCVFLALPDCNVGLSCRKHAQADSLDGSDRGRAQKKALIRYHPDRHHAAGMAAQVEAEELFKIVSKAPLSVAPAVKYPATRHPFPPRRR